jgi:MoaA/NifB/PqqE/SkfB family radical SAM enzyme
VISGGEPMLAHDIYFRVCEISRSLGLRTISVINGTRIRTLSEASTFIEAGPDEVGISMDGPTPEIHDRLRGRDGTFKQAVDALDLLLRARTTLRKPTTIYIMGLLTRSSYPHLDEFYDLALNQIGVDKLKLTALQPTFLYTRIGQQQPSDDFFAIESQVDPEALSVLLARCDAKYDLHYNPRWVDQIVSYYRSLNGTSDLTKGWSGGFTTDNHICNSPERNIMVSLDGRASLCFSNAFANISLNRPGDLKRFWEGKELLSSQMSTCNALCGIGHCVRREHATSSPKHQGIGESSSRRSTK